MLSIFHKKDSFPQDIHFQATLEMEIDDQIIGPSTSTGKIRDLSEVHFNPDTRYLSKTTVRSFPIFSLSLSPPLSLF